MRTGKFFGGKSCCNELITKLFVEKPSCTAIPGQYIMDKSVKLLSVHGPKISVDSNPFIVNEQFWSTAIPSVEITNLPFIWIS